MWHGGSGNRTTERRAVLALRFLPTDLPSRAKVSFDEHFPGLRLPEDDDDDVDDDAQRIVDALRTQVNDLAALAL